METNIVACFLTVMISEVKIRLQNLDFKLNVTNVWRSATNQLDALLVFGSS